VVGESMSVDEAQEFHSLQTDAFKYAEADMTTAVTMTYAEEAIGIARAAAAVDLPVAIGVTVETDGCLPSGQPLGEAIEAIDQASDGVAAYFMINCAHPTHFDHVLDSDTSWAHRVKSIRANASTMSHEELDNAEELDRGDPAALAAHYVQLREMLPDLRVVGGCCGTDHEHIEAITAALAR
jgi:S-methylmethionine-dependent homocysteine/selenocysteine methylase